MLPTLLALPFVVVLAADVGRWALARWLPPTPLIGSAAITFEPVDRVVDLTDEHLSGCSWLELGRGWLPVRPAGRWSLGDRSRLRLAPPALGYRRLLLDLTRRPEGRGAAELAVELNGVGCGRVTLEKGRQQLAFDLPAGGLRPGVNIVEMVHPLPPGEHRGSARFALRWHRLALVEGVATTFAELDEIPAWELDGEGERLRVRRSGTLTLVFATSGFKSVAFRYAFLGMPPGGGGPMAEATLTRTEDGAPVCRATLDSARRQGGAQELGPVRFSGPARLIFEVSLTEGTSFELLSPVVGRLY